VLAVRAKLAVRVSACRSDDTCRSAECLPFGRRRPLNGNRQASNGERQPLNGMRELLNDKVH
jgi:hypothetical protein